MKNWWIKNRFCARTQKRIDFITNIAESKGECYATQRIRELKSIGLCDSEKGVVELPSCFTKRSLFERFYSAHGSIVKSDSIGKYPILAEWQECLHDDSSD